MIQSPFLYPCKPFIHSSFPENGAVVVSCPLFYTHSFQHPFPSDLAHPPPGKNKYVSRFFEFLHPWLGLFPNLMEMGHYWWLRVLVVSNARQGCYTSRIPNCPSLGPKWNWDTGTDTETQEWLFLFAFSPATIPNYSQSTTHSGRTSTMTRIIIVVTKGTETVEEEFRWLLLVQEMKEEGLWRVGRNIIKRFAHSRDITGGLHGSSGARGTFVWTISE